MPISRSISRFRSAMDALELLKAACYSLTGSTIAGMLDADRHQIAHVNPATERKPEPKATVCGWHPIKADQSMFAQSKCYEWGTTARRFP